MINKILLFLALTVISSSMLAIPRGFMDYWRDADAIVVVKVENKEEFNIKKAKVLEIIYGDINSPYIYLWEQALEGNKYKDYDLPDIVDLSEAYWDSLRKEEEIWESDIDSLLGISIEKNHKIYTDYSIGDTLIAFIGAQKYNWNTFSYHFPDLEVTISLNDSKEDHYELHYEGSFIVKGEYSYLLSYTNGYSYLHCRILPDRYKFKEIKSMLKRIRNDKSD